MKWVAAEGVVYPDFTENLFFNDIENVQFRKFFAGVDWGYEHYGCIVVIGEDIEGNYYLLEENAYQHKEIDFWVNVANRIKDEYGNIMFYADSARTEYVVRFQREGLRCVNANKAVLEGIADVATLFKTNKLFVNSNAKRFKEEIYNYVWKPNADEPVKVMDDVMDGLRYAIHSEKTMKNGKYSDDIYNKGKVSSKPIPNRRGGVVF